MVNRVVRILHVDDLEEESILVRVLLSDIESYDIQFEWVPETKTALQILRKTTFDVCIVDYYLGHDNGLVFIRAALAEGIQTPFILMSGQKDPTIDREALQAGVRRCIDKNNITTAALFKAIQEIIGQ